MGSDKLYRWEKRREKALKADKGFQLDILDWVILTLIFALFFISLRLFFIFETVTAPCLELAFTAGQALGYPPMFQLTFAITLLMGLFWLCVTLHRIIFRPAHWALISWHFTLFLSILILAIANWNFTSATHFNPPDGVMVVEKLIPNITNDGIEWTSPQNLYWSDYRDNRWYAFGTPACIWLNENKVSYHDRSDQINRFESVPNLILQGRLFESLHVDQRYRPLTDYERSLFIDIKTCQANIMNYGQAPSACRSLYDYPVPPGTEPPEHILEIWFSGEYILKSPQW